MNPTEAERLTVAEVAAMRGVKPHTITSYLARGQMPAPTGRVGATPFWHAEDITAWTERGTK